MLQELKSKKFITTIIAAIIMIANDALGKPIGEETMYAVLGMLGVYVMGQGVADHGAQGKARAVERAIKQGGIVSEVVQQVMGGKPKQYIHDDDEEEGPHWEDTSEMDEEDKPREILGQICLI